MRPGLARGRKGFLGNEVRHGERDRFDYRDRLPRKLEGHGFNGQDGPTCLFGLPPTNWGLAGHHRVEHAPQAEFQELVEVVHL